MEIYKAFSYFKVFFSHFSKETFLPPIFPKSFDHEIFLFGNLLGKGREVIDDRNKTYCYFTEHILLDGPRMEGRRREREE